MAGALQDLGGHLAVHRIVFGHQNVQPPALARHRRVALLVGDRIAPRGIEAAQRMGGTGQRRRIDGQIQDGRKARSSSAVSSGAADKFAQQDRHEFRIGLEARRSSAKRTGDCGRARASSSSG